MNILSVDKNDFTEDEGKVIAISKKGLSRLLMAKELDMNFNTLVSHLKNIFFQLGIHSLTQLAMYAVKMGY
jgi:DNA-binding NarL/FixJ family response regulator